MREGQEVTMLQGHYAGRKGQIISIRGSLYDIRIKPQNKRRSSDASDSEGIIVTNCKSTDFK